MLTETFKILENKQENSFSEIHDTVTEKRNITRSQSGKTVRLEVKVDANIKVAVNNALEINKYRKIARKSLPGYRVNRNKYSENAIETIL